MGQSHHGLCIKYQMKKRNALPGRKDFLAPYVYKALTSP